MIPDPAADIRAFRLTPPSPLGTKRSGFAGTFIPSVNAAVDAFYAQVIQTVAPLAVHAGETAGSVAEEAVETIDALDEADQSEIEEPGRLG